MAPEHPEAALAIARRISVPYFRSQALAVVSRWSDDQHAADIACEAIASAQSDADAYKSAAAMAWPIASLVERGDHALALESLARARERRRAATDVLLLAWCNAEEPATHRERARKVQNRHRSIRCEATSGFGRALSGGLDHAGRQIAQGSTGTMGAPDEAAVAKGVLPSYFGGTWTRPVGVAACHPPRRWIRPHRDPDFVGQFASANAYPTHLSSRYR